MPPILAGQSDPRVHAPETGHGTGHQEILRSRYLERFGLRATQEVDREICGKPTSLQIRAWSELVSLA